jgi:hypothetical protein
LQGVVNGRQGAIQTHGLAQLAQGHVRFAPEQSAHLVVMDGLDQRFATRKAVARSDTAGAPPLLEELFDHADGNPITHRHLLTCAFLTVVGAQYPLAQIQR